MTTVQDKQVRFTVRLAQGIGDLLDSVLSPGDAIAALDDLSDQLPKVHKTFVPRRLCRVHGRPSRLYHGRFGWLDIGFTYAELGDKLFVVSLWPDEKWGDPYRPTRGCVIGRDVHRNALP